MIISPEPWAGNFVSKHHYACELAKRGHKVIFHGPPDAKGAMRLARVAETPGDIRVLHAVRVFPGLRFLPAPLRITLEARWLRKVEALAGARVDVVWNFENSRFYDLGFAGRRLKIYQQVDLNQNFYPHMAASSADLVIALSDPIAARLKSAAPNLIRLTHGHAQVPHPVDLPDGVVASFEAAQRNAVLVGNLDIAYLDVTLLAQLVKAHADVQFHFIGGYSPSSKLFRATAYAPNVVFWGRQPAHLLPGFLERADLLLLAYLAEEHLDQLANPHKMMEYLASGRTVLATRTLDYEDRHDLVEMARDQADYANRFSAIMANPDIWNSHERIAARRAFAADNTYTRQIERIAMVLGQCGTLIT